MPLFTFYLDYKGGTYISQVRARSYKFAPKVWAEQLDISVIPNREKNFKEKLLRSINDDDNMLTPIDGVSKTWCCSPLLLERALVHFTQTSE